MKVQVLLGEKDDVAEICHFIKLSYPICFNWPMSLLDPWVRWYCDMGFCVIGRESVDGSGILIRGHIKTLLLGRPCSNFEFARDDIYFFDSGNNFFVDLVITKHTRAIPVMTKVMIASVGEKEYLAFTRDRGNMKTIHKYPIKRILRFYAPRTT